MDFGYFHEEESEQFAFYRIPQVLFKDEKFAKLSTDAKVLYGLFLNRVSLSKKNHWVDEEGRVYVYYTLVSIQEDLHCASQKALKLLKELERYGLIERVKQGLCKPDRIYVKNFILLQKSPVQSGENHHAGVVKITSPECRESPPNNTEINKTEKNDTELSIPPSAPAPPKRQHIGRERQADRIDRMDAYREIIRENIDYDILLHDHPLDAEQIDGYVELMLEVCCSTRDFIRISKEDMPTGVVKARFLKLTREHIEYVMDCVSRNTTQIGNIKAYLLAALYNAPVTIGQYYTALVSHDMAEGVGG